MLDNNIQKVNMLHMINQSPFRVPVLATVNRYLLDGDIVLLTEDAVYSAQAGNAHVEVTQKALGKNKVYALSADLKARGISNLLDGVVVVDYEGFVDLVEDHQVNTWL